MITYLCNEGMKMDPCLEYLLRILPHETQPNREIDKLIGYCAQYVFKGWKSFEDDVLRHGYVSAYHTHSNEMGGGYWMNHFLPYFTSSIDDALKLNQDDRLFSIGSRVKVPGFVAVLNNDGKSYTAMTPQHALSLAFVSQRL